MCSGLLLEEDCHIKMEPPVRSCPNVKGTTSAPPLLAVLHKKLIIDVGAYN